MNLMKWLRKRALALSGGAVQGGSPSETSRNLLISSPSDVKDFMLRQYDVWYKGDSNELLNFYTQANAIQANYEPWYFKNVRSYFWSRSSTESDIKRSHSHIPQSIVDTFSYIMGVPTVKVSDKTWDARLSAVLEDGNFWTKTYVSQKNKTLYQGYGAYKISWDTSISKDPFVSYYGARDVDFVERGNRVTSIIFRDWYSLDEFGNTRILVTETRSAASGSVLIETKAFRQMPVAENDAQLSEILPEEFGGYPQLSGISPLVRIEGTEDLLAYPCIFFTDDTEDGLGMPGRSVFAGRIDLFDDLDQELSQKSNSVGKSTPVEYFNTDFLERDERTHMFKMPHLYDRKYTMYRGGKNADGTSMTDSPVQVTQPAINFMEYSSAAVETLKFILHGLLSPATMGIDVAKQSTQESQREKEKITISTRNHLIAAETPILRRLFSGILKACEYLETGSITVQDHDISIKYNDFADSSFEEKLGSLGEAVANGNMSPRMYVERLHGDALSDEEKQAEIEFVSLNHDPRAQAELQAQMMAAAPEPEGEEPMDGEA